MTPTEQDKELRERIAKCFTDTQMTHDPELSLFDTDQTIENIIDLITADRKRVELKARLNEVQNAYEHWINGRRFMSSYFRDRIAQLSNTKESSDE